jgi:hypothetical protein
MDFADEERDPIFSTIDKYYEEAVALSCFSLDLDYCDQPLA